MTVRFTLNGAPVEVDVEARTSLADALRHDCGATGTHVGCEEGACGACTVLLDGAPVRSCLLFAVQCEGAEVTTVEGLSPADGSLSPVQAALHAHHGLQCGFCTPGVVVTLEAAAAGPARSDDELAAVASGVLCRCTGYRGIIEALRSVAGVHP